MTLLEKPAATVPAPTAGPRTAGPQARWTRWLGAAGLVAGVGVLGGLWTPRGPVTVTESLATMLLALAAGVGAGWLLRSRLGVLALPMLYAVAFEVTRLPAQGPTVDMLNVEGIYGWLAAVSAAGCTACSRFPRWWQAAWSVARSPAAAGRGA